MKHALEKFTRIMGYRPTTIVELYGGLNSVNYLIDNTYVLRIKLQNIDCYYRPELEALVEDVCGKFNIGATLIFLDVKDGTKITEFIPNTRYMSIPLTNPDIVNAAKIINKFHKLPSLNIDDFDKHARLNFYRSLTDHHSNHKDENSLINKIVKIDRRYPQVVCHNDLVRGNLLYRDECVYLIDYEYAGMNNYLFDLASFITENDILDERLIDVFLSSYDQSIQINKDDFKTYCHYLDLLWFYWAMAMHKKTNNPIYNQIAQIKNARLENIND